MSPVAGCVHAFSEQKHPEASSARAQPANDRHASPAGAVTALAQPAYYNYLVIRSTKCVQLWILELIPIWVHIVKLCEMVQMADWEIHIMLVPGRRQEGQMLTLWPTYRRKSPSPVGSVLVCKGMCTQRLCATYFTQERIAIVLGSQKIRG